MSESPKEIRMVFLDGNQTYPQVAKTTNSESPSRSNEDFYDTEIAPELSKLAKKCEDRGMSFIATVEYDPEGVGYGRTTVLAEKRSFATTMQYLTACSQNNIDKLIMALLRHVRESKVPHSSAYLHQLGVHYDPEKRS